MNKRGMLAKILISMYYIVLAVAVFWLLHSNLSGMIHGTGLMRNAFLKDSSTLIDSLFLVDNNPGKSFSVGYDIPQSLMLVEEDGMIKTQSGIVVEYNKPSERLFSISGGSDSLVMRGGE